MSSVHGRSLRAICDQGVDAPDVASRLNACLRDGVSEENDPALPLEVQRHGGGPTAKASLRE